MPTPAKTKLVNPVLLAEIGAPHGIRGELRLKTYTADPFNVADYGPLFDEQGRSYTIAAIRDVKGEGMVVVRFDEVKDRTAAERLTLTKLYVERDALPEAEEDEFYYSDLEGLKAETPSGEPLGTVLLVQNFGAGDLLELKPLSGPSVYVPFTREAVPLVDVKGGRVVIDPPEGLFGPAVKMDEEDGE